MTIRPKLVACLAESAFGVGRFRQTARDRSERVRICRVRGAMEAMPAGILQKGTLLGEWDHPVEWGKVREFARAVHDPLLQQEPMEPPITFPVVLTAEFIERFVSEILPLDRTRAVHGEQEYEYLRPLRIRETVHCRAVVVGDVMKEGKRGGQMRIVTIEIELSNRESGETIGFERMTSIEQEKK